MTLDLSKPVQTRGGSAARVYAQDGHGEYCLHGAVRDSKTGRWLMQSWTAGGRSIVWNDQPQRSDLINVPAASKYRWWAPSEVPIGAVVRIHGRRKLLVKVDDASRVPWSEPIENYEWCWPHEQFTESAWRPCGVLE